MFKTARGSISISTFLLGFEFVEYVCDKLGTFFSLVFTSELVILLLFPTIVVSIFNSCVF